MLLSMTGNSNMYSQQLHLDPMLKNTAFLYNYGKHLMGLVSLAQDEPWAYADPLPGFEYPETAVLDRYLKDVFRLLVYDFNRAATQEDADDLLCARTGYVCFHTGLLTKNYKDIFCLLERNRMPGGYQPYVLKGFGDNASVLIRSVDALPKHPLHNKPTIMAAFNPDMEIRIDADHILDTPENRMRIPEALRDFPNLALLLEAAVLQALKVVRHSPSIIVPQIFQGRLQYLLPISLYQPDKTDLVMTLSEANGFYLASTCITPCMAYGNARLCGKPTAPWLASVVQSL